MLHPLVSIVMPVYNGSNFMKKAIDSALVQTYDKFEIIVVNDGSNDDGKTAEIARSYGDKIIFVDRKENRGIAYTINEGIANMHGEYFTWLSHDDAYKPEKIANQVKYLNELAEKYPDDLNHICLCGATETINANDKVIRLRPLNQRTKKLRTRKETLLDNIRNYEIAGCSVLIPKKAFEECGGFDPNWITMQDADMWFRFIFAGYTFFYQDMRLTQKRHHGEETGRRLAEIYAKERELFQVQLTEKMVQLDDLQNWNFFLEVGASHRRMQYKEAAKISYSYAKKLNPTIGFWISYLPKAAYAATYGSLRALAKRIYWKLIEK